MKSNCFPSYRETEYTLELKNLQKGRREKRTLLQQRCRVKMLCQKCILVIKIISFVLGTSMNLLVLLVRLVRLYQRKRISSYHFIILNIALADLIYSMLIIVDINAKDFQWPFSEGACQVVKSLQGITGDIPGLFMVLLAFERYQGTIKPLGRRFRMRTLFLVTFIFWFFTIGVRFPFGFYLKKDHLNNRCLTRYPFPEFIVYYRHVLLLCFMVFPFLATAIIHVMICAAIKKHSSKMTRILKHTADVHQKICITSRFSSSSRSQQDELYSTDRPSSVDSVFLPDQNPENRSSMMVFKDLFQKIFLCRCSAPSPRQLMNNKKKQKTPLQWGIKLKIHILVLISLAFFFCMFPSHLVYLLFFYKKERSINLNLLIIFTWMKYLHCFANGFIYSLLDEKFRRDLHAILKSAVTCKPHYKNDFRRSVLSQSSVDTMM